MGSTDYTTYTWWRETNGLKGAAEAYWARINGKKCIVKRFTPGLNESGPFHAYEVEGTTHAGMAHSFERAKDFACRYAWEDESPLTDAEADLGKLKNIIEGIMLNYQLTDVRNGGDVPWHAFDDLMEALDRRDPPVTFQKGDFVWCKVGDVEMPGIATGTEGDRVGVVRGDGVVYFVNREDLTKVEIVE